MTRKQLQVLISAGVFSTALLNGIAYAADSSGSDDTTVQASSNTASGDSSAATTNTQVSKQKQTTSKDSSQMGCSSANGCGSH